MDQERNKQKIITGFVLVFAVVIIAVTVTALNKNSQNTQTGSSATTHSTSTTPTNSGASSSTPSSASSSGSYKDGSYTANDSYRTPGGTEEIGVTLTVKGNTVTDVSLNQSANNRDSRAYQYDFEQEYKSYVVGKSVDSISLSGVAGASLTSEGFNGALEQIKTQAKA